VSGCAASGGSEVGRDACALGPRRTFSSIGPDALRRLGLDVNGPLRDLRSAFERLLPKATSCGYFAAIRKALVDGELGPGDAESQLQWLADNLRIDRPGVKDAWPWWLLAWEQASASAQLTPPVALGTASRRVLLNELLARPDYKQRLADALAMAFRAELNR
jgi:hypothetical protein